MKGPLENGVDHRIPVFFRHLGQILVAGETGIVHQDINAAPFLHYGIDAGLYLILVTDIALNSHGLEPFIPQVLRSRSAEHTSELQSLMRISYAVFCLKKKNTTQQHITTHTNHY